MSEEKPSQNQRNAGDNASIGGWDFFIAKEDQSNKLRRDEFTTYSGIPASRSEASKLPDWIVAVFTIVIALVGYLQWSAITGQLGEMQASGKQTDRLIGLYTQQLVQLQNQAANTHDLAVAAKSQANNTRTIATAGIEATQLDQRAWFGISDTEILQYDPHDSGKPIRFKILFRNTGKTPARQIHEVGLLRFYPSEFTGPADLDWKSLQGYFKASKDRFMAAPNATRATIVETSDQANDAYIKANFFAMEHHALFLYYFGEVDYVDIYNRAHTTRFCLLLMENIPKQLAHCTQGNDMD